ncbi:RNA-binding protein 42-like [Dorcoceras hygrometricum]|uniref:RNA-binding protein 42-like n=1 Tax=Dorcoceras hygrometricum TaxID=472368 RepID=A0A2Z6ZQY9_9LAMI|nr:RNA-binding protein 42-like [Dorcoceras hygrometricum]
MESYNPDARFQSQYLKIQQKRKAVEECISSEAVDNLRRGIKAGCQLLSEIQMAKATRRNQRSRWKEPMAKIKSCKLPQFKGTRFVLFWETVQFTEDVCTHMERRQISHIKR